MGAAEVGKPEPRSRTQAVLKWVAAIGAVVSLVIGLFTVTRLVADVRERERAISESLATAQRQQAGGDYAAAWTTLEAAQKSADEGGTFAKLTGELSDARRLVREAHQDLAMLWLRNLRVPADRKFSDVVDKLLPVLERGVAATHGTDGAAAAARADLLAHVGWSHFLKQRDGASGPDPVAQYRAAVAADSTNPWAHAYWGHYLLSHGERTPASVAEGIGHFDAAAKSGRERAVVRSLHLAALRNLGDELGAPYLLRFADGLRRGGEPMPPAVVAEMQSFYARIVAGNRVDDAMAKALPAERHAELVKAVFDAGRLDAARAAVRDVATAMLYEAAGDTDNALQAWRAVHAKLAPDHLMRKRADQAIRRLGALPRRTG